MKPYLIITIFVMLCIQQKIYSVDNSCLEKVSIALNSLDEKFIPKIKGKMAFEPSVTTNGFHFFKSYSYIGENGEKLGYIHFTLFEKTKTLLIADLHVFKKRNRIGTALFKKAVEHFSNIKRISTTLGIDNYRIFLETYEKTNSLKKAFMATPAYKMRKSLGFINIDLRSFELNREDMSVSFQVYK